MTSPAAASPSDASTTALSAAAATKLRDDAIAAATALETEAAALRSSNIERSQQLQEEADLLKSAAAAQERVRAAAAALDEERAQADALAQQAADLRARRLVSFRDDTTMDGDDHTISSDAAALTHLHNQASAVQNIKNLIPIVLDLQSSNYSKWRGYILLILGRFSLKDHVLNDEDLSADPTWARLDYVVVSWIFNTVSPDILDILHERDGITARDAWLRIEEQFLNNRESRAMILDAEFRTFSQGALPIDAYCRKMKSMADALADLGEPVAERTLVLNVLRGLSERFKFLAQLITQQRPLPSFHNVRADLRLAELNMESSPAPPSALVTSSVSKPAASAPTPSAAPARHPHPAAGGSASAKDRGRRRRGGRGQGGQGSSPGGPSSGPQWPSFLNPWTGSIHMWPGSTPGGSRGSQPRPGAPPQQAMMAGTLPPGGYYPPAPGTYYQAPPTAPAPAWSPWDP
jgi:hypothetical protein